MPVAYATHNRILTISLSGDIDHHSVKGLLHSLEKEVDAVLPRQVVVDCSGVTFMDSSGIAILLRLRQQRDHPGPRPQRAAGAGPPGRRDRAAHPHRPVKGAT